MSRPPFGTRANDSIARSKEGSLQAFDAVTLRPRSGYPICAAMGRRRSNLVLQERLSMARDLHMNCVRIGSLSVAKALHEFLEQEAAPGTSISAEAFWSGFAELLRDCGTRNRQLLEVRDELQSRIDQYHRERSGEPLDLGDYERFLRDIGYVLPEGNDFAIRTTNVDDEIAVVAGPQLVVPLSNARYALNAANARWGSLYDALYGTDAIPEDGGATRTGTYNKIRGERVVARGRAMLDETVPLARDSHRDVVSYSVGGLLLSRRRQFAGATARRHGYRSYAARPIRRLSG